MNFFKVTLCQPPALSCSIATMASLGTCVERVRAPLFALACALTTVNAHATGGISCVSADGTVSIDMLVSLSGEGAGSGVTSVKLTAPGFQADLPWKITAAKADFQRKSLNIEAASDSPVHSSSTWRLGIRRSSGTLDTGRKRIPVSCDWGEFS